jgi:MFS superfamily sulfate permease-like transporter
VRYSDTAELRGRRRIALRSAMVGMFIYAIFRPSRQLAVTPTSSSAAVLTAQVAPIVGGDDYAMCTSLRRLSRPA